MAKKDCKIMFQLQQEQGVQNNHTKTNKKAMDQRYILHKMLLAFHGTFKINKMA
jgi:hypothetical protein